MTLSDRYPVSLTTNPAIHSGIWCFHGSRLPAETILGWLARGASCAEIEAAFPTLPLGWFAAMVELRPLLRGRFRQGWRP